MEDKIKVLLVENDDINISVIQAYLKRDFNLTIVSNGTEAIESVKNEHYQIILMDINLGRGMSGVEVTKIIRQMEGYANIPIIAVTAFALEGDKEEFLEAGCSHYISKPFLKSQLIELIEEAIQENIKK